MGLKIWVFFVFFFHQCGNQWVAGDIPCAWCVEAHKQVKVSFLSLFSACGTSKTAITCVSNQGFDFGGFLHGVCFFGDGHGVGYSCMQSQPNLEFAAFWFVL